MGTADGGESEPPVMATLERTFTMSFDEVRNMLSWSPREDVIAHPLNDLDILLCVSLSFILLLRWIADENWFRVPSVLKVLEFNISVPENYLKVIQVFESCPEVDEFVVVFEICNK